MAGGGRIIGPAELWGPILSAARQRATTQELFDRYINPAVKQLGGRLSFEAVTQIGILRSNATQVINASQAFMRTPGISAITAEMLGRPFYGRPPSAQEANPAYEVLYEAHVVTARGPETAYWRLSYGRNLPETVQGILDDIDAFSSDFADAYGAELQSIGQVLVNAL